MSGTYNYHLVYFPMRARGAPVKWILKAADLDYTEETIEPFGDWKDRKQDYDYLKVPVLMVDGQQLHQTVVICRYLGETHHLTSNDPWTITRQQEVAEAVHEISYIMADFLIARVQKQEDRQKQLFEKAKQRVPEVFSNVERVITEEGWIHSNKMSWVDVFVAAYIDLFQSYFPGALEDMTRCQQLLKRVSSIPNIAQHIEKRPDWHPFETPVGIEG